MGSLALLIVALVALDWYSDHWRTTMCKGESFACNQECTIHIKAEKVVEIVLSASVGPLLKANASSYRAYWAKRCLFVCLFDFRLPLYSGFNAGLLFLTRYLGGDASNTAKGTLG